jgi:hypothetical protein
VLEFQKNAWASFLSTLSIDLSIMSYGDRLACAKEQAIIWFSLHCHANSRYFRICNFFERIGGKGR